MGVPTGLARHLVALHRLVAAEDVLNRACHHMVDARHTVSAGRSFIEHICRRAFALADTATEHIFIVPQLQDFLVDIRQVKPVVLVEFFHF